ncbi:lytic transglycosylase domain-containing protein [Paenibacillus sp. RUD330]|uniref:lytic transglycosylase domain-containing protein n=1 Tax=Paenibacillus sp. RUD330 TaxID=2023772 RepID=UPI000B925DA7|nr:lytic transglycosylase domain-containing protein [Paenibacillus sp. RUD330]ASS66206.1 lytic transglycosylase domain-containing protein [Paenibacillus sp. RUD330]
MTGTVSAPEKYAGLFQAASQKYGLGNGILERIAKQESGFNPNAKNSKSGAAGMMQFMPGTAQGYGIDPYNPAQAIDAAGKMVSGLLAKYDGDMSKALAGYNWGGGNVDKAVKKYGANWLAYAPAETKNYIKKIMG